MVYMDRRTVIGNLGPRAPSPASAADSVDLNKLRFVAFHAAGEPPAVPIDAGLETNVPGMLSSGE